MSRTDHHRRTPLEHRGEPKPNARLAARRARRAQQRVMTRQGFDTLPSYQPNREVRGR